MRIAHLTDLHLLEERALHRSTPGLARLRTIGLGRPIDPAGRAERALRVVRRALLANPDHLVITGDLTEDGHRDQFAMLAAVLD